MAEAARRVLDQASTPFSSAFASIGAVISASMDAAAPSP